LVAVGAAVASLTGAGVLSGSVGAAQAASRKAVRIRRISRAFFIVGKSGLRACSGGK
jgi:hypothetical protein